MATNFHITSHILHLDRECQIQCEWECKLTVNKENERPDEEQCTEIIFLSCDGLIGIIAFANTFNFTPDAATIS